MASPKELRAAIVESRAQLQQTLHEAHAAWERKPANSPEGEEAWPPRKVAEHLLGTDWFFTNGICKACGAPEVARPDFTAATPGQAAAALTRNGAKFDDLLRHVSDTDLEKPLGADYGGLNVGQAMAVWPNHVADHINQIKTACA